MDAIRMEVREDLLVDDINEPAAHDEYLKRSHDRYQTLLHDGICFIDDSSADRSWKQHKDDQYYQLEEHGYDYFIISMDVSREFIDKLYRANKSYSAKEADRFFEDHQKFLELYGADIGVHITDENFLTRMSVCHDAVSEFLKAH
jgi:hypothetical protein